MMASEKASQIQELEEADVQEMLVHDCKLLLKRVLNAVLEALILKRRRRK
jgi:hypothetical protein